MKKFVSLFAWLAATFALSSSVALAQDAQKEIDRLEDLRYEAMIKNDYATFESIVADDWVYNTALGVTETKQTYIANLKSGTVKIKKAVRKDVKTRFYGDTAVVMGKTDVDANVKGEDKTFHLLYLNVWVKRGDKWQLVARESTFQKQ
jgi:ketosteroid isomerase-like protein